MMLHNEELLISTAKTIGEEDAIKVIKAIISLGETTDDKIATETEMKLNDVRRILYKLSNHSIIISTRSRDPDSGWFIFKWRLQPDQIEGYIKNMKKRILDKLETRLTYEEDHDFYICNNPGCKRIFFEDAVESIFRCPECKQSLKHFDNTPIIKVLKNKIDKLKEELNK